MKIEDNGQYMEGQWVARGMIQYIERTTYGSLENAIKTKEEVVRLFETEFGFSRDMENPDSKYAWELGLLEALKEAHDNNPSK